jgi:hypothetical protein
MSTRAPTPAQAFIREIDAFLEQSGMSATAFGRAAVKDPNFVSDLRGGRLPNLGLVGRVQDFIQSESRKLRKASAA